MIYGKISLKDWRNAPLAGETPDSSFEDSNLRLFFYGTLYNRDILGASPEETDACVAAHAHQKEGESGFSRLDGSFTIVYFSAEQCGVLRDHHGTHFPIYYTVDGAFATSLELLATHFSVPRVLNKPALSHFLQSGILTASGSVLQDVSRLEAGRIWLLEEGRQQVKNLISLDYKPVIASRPDVAAYSRRYGELHAAAIRRRIGDSHRVGILLSGGYDSGANLAALRSIYEGEIDSYSIGFKGDTWSELPLARIMSQAFRTRHHEYEIDGSEITALPAIIDFLGEPFVEGGLMVNYCAMHLIGENKPDVILGGDGSDQYFGTSGRELAMHYLSSRSLMLPFMQGAFRLLNRESFDKDGKSYRIRFHLDKILHILEGDRFGFSDFHLQEILQHPQTDWMAAAKVKTDTRSFAHLYAQHAQQSDLDLVINRIILYKASRMAQMFGNNLTYPYMDLTLYDFLQELPLGLKCKGDNVLSLARGQGISKYLLKYHYKPLLPDAITQRKKQGGFAPMPLFFRSPAQRTRLKEFILSSKMMDDFLNREAVERFLTQYDRDAFQEGSWFWYRQNRAIQYFNLLTLAVWWERFVEGNEVSF